MNEILKGNLKDIMSNFIKNIDIEDNIDYSNIDEYFLLYLNKLLYYVKFNKKFPEDKKDINPLYEYLCSGNKNEEKRKYLNEQYLETFNYFNTDLEKILIEYGNNYNQNLKTINNIDNKEVSININSNGYKNNGNSTRVSSDLSDNSLNDEHGLNNNLQKGNLNNINNNSDNCQELIENAVKNYYFEYFKECNELKDLCAKIPIIIKK